MSTQEQDFMPGLIAQLQSAEPPQRLELLAKAADERSADPRPLLLMAAEYMHLERTDQAEGAYILALQRAPNFAIARFQLGLLQFTSGRPAAAMATWAPLEALTENEPLLLFKRGLEALGRDQFQDAQRWLLAGIGANTVNEPLNRDMRMVIDRIVQAGLLPNQGGAVPADGAAPDAPGAPAPSGAVQSPLQTPDAAPGPAQGQEHFLVTSYGRKP